jgi:hypothetical protein
LPVAILHGRVAFALSARVMIVHCIYGIRELMWISLALPRSRPAAVLAYGVLTNISHCTNIMSGVAGK